LADFKTFLKTADYKLEITLLIIYFSAEVEHSMFVGDLSTDVTDEQLLVSFISLNLHDKEIPTNKRIHLTK